jgi:hypothetical protein
MGSRKYEANQMASDVDSADTTSKLEGTKARAEDTQLSDLATVLMREHEDILERRKRVQELFPEAKKTRKAKQSETSNSAAKESDPPTMSEYYARAHACKPGLAALCLSGGGIRSAAFGLGVIQGLARLQLLHRFDYLSTVSGGGYIGSWLTSWVQTTRRLSNCPK